MTLSKYNFKKPFFALAPMANITTYPFASQCAEYGADVVWTPMVHTDTILNNWAESEKILNFNPPVCHPELDSGSRFRIKSGMTKGGGQSDKKNISNYIVQIIGQDPRKVADSIKIIEKELSPIGIDLNFACPDKNIIKSGCGGAMMQRPDEIIEIVKSAKKATNLPISVKTRAGWDNYDDIFDLTTKLQGAGIDMLTVHPRAVKQAFTGQADWNILKKLCQEFPELTIVGSGDVQTWGDAIEKQKESGCAGVMIGRGALGKPWVFKEIKNKQDHTPSLAEIKNNVLDLATKADEIWGDKGITESKKHFAWYFKGFDGASEYRKRLMDAKTLAEVREILE
jgi:nifR3 family TIM-barrel protein